MLRKRYLKIVKQTYKNFRIFGREECTYCGRDAFSRDHVPAVVNVYCYGLKKYPRVSVPCCRLCNSMLGDQPLHTVKSRAEWLYKRYEKRYKRVIDLPFWSRDEIEIMGPIMQRDLISMERDRKEIEFVLDSLDRVVMYLTQNSLG